MAHKCIASTMQLKLHLAKLLETSLLLNLAVSFQSSFCLISQQCQQSPSFVPPWSTSFTRLPGCTTLFLVSLSFSFADSSSSHWRIRGIVLGPLRYHHSLPLSFFSLVLNTIWTVDSHFYLWPQHLPLSCILILTYLYVTFIYLFIYIIYIFIYSYLYKYLYITLYILYIYYLYILTYLYMPTWHLHLHAQIWTPHLPPSQTWSHSFAHLS